MATPLTGLQHRDGGLGLMAGPANQMDSSPSKSCLKSSALKSPILIFLFFHKAIRSELDGLHRAAMDFATNQDSEINPLLERYHFFRAIYKHHCNAEDEVGSFLFLLQCWIWLRLKFWMFVAFLSDSVLEFFVLCDSFPGLPNLLSLFLLFRLEN